MTQEEKAKAYDEALEKAKVHINNKGIGDTVDLCKHLFPELRESEDEKIRKEIISLVLKVMGQEKDNLSDDKYNAMLAWLEKQKEPKKEFHIPDYMGIAHYSPVPIEQKEQKPAEWSEEDERMRNQLIYDIEHHKKDGLISAKQNKATKALYNGIEKCYDEKIAWLKSLSPSWKPSEHQMTILKAVKEYVGRGSGYWGEALGSLIEDLEKLM